MERKEAPLPNLRNQVVIITGAGSGMGREMARAFTAEGAKTVLSDIQAEPLEETAELVRNMGGETVAVVTDVSKRRQVDRMVRTAIDSYGRVDILINNAGYGYGATIEQTSKREFQELWETNVLSVLFGMQAVLPTMRRQGSGHIISIASAAGKIAYPGIGAYSATKHAIVALTDSLRAEVADAGIHASVVLPIGTLTKFFQSARLAEGGSVGPHGPTQSAQHVAQKVVACAKRPTPEVLPYMPLRIGIAIKGIAPSIMDAISRRAFREQTQRDDEPTRVQSQEEAQHGEA